MRRQPGSWILHCTCRPCSLSCAMSPFYHSIITMKLRWIITSINISPFKDKVTTISKGKVLLLSLSNVNNRTVTPADLFFFLFFKNFKKWVTCQLNSELGRKQVNLKTPPPLSQLGAPKVRLTCHKTRPTSVFFFSVSSHWLKH